MSNDKKRSHRQHGFTLIEVMMALLIFMVIALGLARLEIAALTTQSGNLHRDEALRLAEEELSRLKSLQFSTSGTHGDLVPGGWIALPDLTVQMRNGSATFARAKQVTDIATSATPLKRLDVAVGWTQGNSTTLLAPTNRNHQTSVSTIIARVD